MLSVNNSYNASSIFQQNAPSQGAFCVLGHFSADQANEISLTGCRVGLGKGRIHSFAAKMLVPVLIAIAAGLLTGIGWWMVYRPVFVALGRRLLRPSAPQAGNGWLRVPLFVLSGQLPVAIWIGLLLISPLTHLILSFFLPAGIAVIGGVVALCGGLMELLTEKKKLIAIERSLLHVAVDRLLTYASVEYATQVLEYILHSPDAIFRLTAARGLGDLGSAQALKLLSAATNDPDQEVRMAAIRGSEAIRRALGDGHAMSVQNMPHHIQEHAALSSQLDQLHGSEFKAAARKLIELEHTMTEVANSQMALRNAFPHLWCTRCHARASEARHARWRYVHCRRCLDALDLRANVRKVTGTIGIDQQAQQPLDKRDLSLPLWDVLASRANFAEVDTLEIYPGNHLEIAIPAVVAALLASWPDRTQAVEIKLIGKPALSADAIGLLQRLNPTFQANGESAG
jgi:HEAT repeats